MIFSRNNRFLQRILSAHIWDMMFFLSFAKCKKTCKFYSLPFGGAVLTPPPYITQPLCNAFNCTIFYQNSRIIKTFTSEKHCIGKILQQKVSLIFLEKRSQNFFDISIFLEIFIDICSNTIDENFSRLVLKSMLF